MAPIKFKCKKVIISLLLSLSILLSPVLNLLFAQERGILMTPSRVIFEGKERATTVKLINPNNEPYTYKIGIVSTRMDKYGNNKEVEQPTEREMFVHKLIRYSPRRATLPAKGWQTVRLMVRKPNDLPPGEYRCQLKASPVIRKKHLDKNQDSNRGVSVAIDLVFAVSIPIIVRHGETEPVKLTPHAPRMITKDNKYYLETNIERAGAHSAFFDVLAYVTPSSENKNRIKISENRGVAIYTENKDRFVHLPLDNRESLKTGSITIELINRENKDGTLLRSETFKSPVD